MAKTSEDLFKRALQAQTTHTKYLQTFEDNLSYFLFGKKAEIVKGLGVTTFPQVDLVDALDVYKPEAWNPLSSFVNAFAEEIGNSDFLINVDPYPVKGKEPWQSFADQMEDYLDELHRLHNRKKHLKGLTLMMLFYGYFGIYTNGRRYWFLTPYEFFPGDANVTYISDQPFVVRKTLVLKATLKKMAWQGKVNPEALRSLDKISDLDGVSLYDIWSLPLDLNCCFLETGQLLYEQPFPYPKRYPFALAAPREILGSFYQKPIMADLIPLLKKYKDSIENIEESSKSIANPILTYDADAGIDVDALSRALREGYKRIIVGKNREGQIAFIRPGSLPSYALSMPEIIRNQMMERLGINDMFLGMKPSGIRAAGAMEALVKGAFRKLNVYSAAIEEAFDYIDNYILEYIRLHKLQFAENPRFKNIEEIFQGNVRYFARETFKGFLSQIGPTEKRETLVRYKANMLPLSRTLQELGYHQPRRIIAQMRKEMAEEQEWKMRLREQLKRPKSLIEEVTSRLKGQLKNPFYIWPARDDKLLVRVHKIDAQRAAFLLSDLTEKVLIEPVTRRKKLTPPPTSVRTPKEERQEVQEEREGQEAKQPQRGKKTLPSVQRLKETLQKLSALAKGQVKKPEEQQSESETSENPKSEENRVKTEAAKKHWTTEEIEERIRSMIRRQRTIRKVEGYLSLPGLYLVEPHAKWIYTGKKTLILKSRPFREEVLNKPHLLLGKKVYGVIIIRDIIEDFDFDKLRRHHMVSPRERKKWWGNQKLYCYIFEFHPFAEPLDWERPQGVQTFVKEVKVKRPEGLPFTGDLKPVKLAPWKVPPPHKPEKKAFQPHEFFSFDRLKELIPPGKYDVSFKVDGLRGFLWVHNGEARMFSDAGNKWPRERIEPILEEAEKKFKNMDVLLDGELVMKEIPRRDIAGYIHGQWEPTKEQLESLRYITWDILYLKDKSLASLPFRKRSDILNQFYPYKRYQKGRIQRVYHGVMDRDEIPKRGRKYMSDEGIVVRDIEASYWATHSTYKVKRQFDVDVRVIAVEKTKVGLPIFHCALRDGTYIGQTYAQAEVTAKPGEIIRVNVEHVTLRDDGSIGWYAPRPKSWKEGKITPRKISTTQVGIGGPDTLDLIKEIYLAGGGSEEKWNAWLPKHKKWKKEVMPKLIKKEIREGVEPSKIG